MTQKICLIIPDSPFLLDARVFPFLGILKIASAWEQNGRSVDVLDLNGIKNWSDVIADYLSLNSDNDFHFVGLTATTPQMPMAFDIAAYIKTRSPGMKLVLGGSHVTLIHTATKLELKNNINNGRSKENLDRILSVFDVLVCGDGELVIEELLSMAKGIIDADDRKSKYFLSSQQFDELPIPARHLVDLKSYKYYIDGFPATSLIGQLGCPYHCGFCSGRNSPYLRAIRKRSVTSIVSEVEFLHKTYGYTGFMFYDDELNVSKSMVELMDSLSDLQDKLGVEFRLRGFIKSELFTDEQARAMYRAGFRWLLCGFESGDVRILQNIQKEATIEDNTRVIEIAQKYNLKTKALMSLGHPGESPETIENTKKWLIQIKPEEFDCTVVTPYPGSPYYDLAVRRDDYYVYKQPKTGDALYQKPLDYTKDFGYYKGIPGSYISYVWTDFISAGELAKQRDILEDEVRSVLNIPFNPAGIMKTYEHSMGQGNVIPDWILRSTKGVSQKEWGSA